MNFSYENYLGLLVGHGVFSVTGQVGVCQDGIYSSVCDVNWDQEDADVICKYSFLLELGMLQIYVFIHDSPVYMLGCMRCTVECTPIKVLQLFCWSMTPYHCWPTYDHPCPSDNRKFAYKMLVARQQPTIDIDMS